jgi:alpha-beta hydrolase superfamily lysophospholipase
VAARRSEPPAGADGLESIEIHTTDGFALRATVREPKRGAKFRGVAVLAHAMFARRTEWEKAGFARALSERGWRTIAFDFRGHGDSGKSASTGADWTYDDLVTRDLPAVTLGARARAKGKKVIVVGHSLGGHVATAAQATGAIDVDGIALVASNVWLPETESSPVRRMTKLAIARAIEAIRARRGYFPARALRLGSDDEASSYMAALWRMSRGFWGSEDGRVDYWDAARCVRLPLFALASDGDPINAHVDCAARFALRTAGLVTFERIAASDDGGKAPGHMEIVTTPSCVSSWERLEQWMSSA